MRSFFAGLTPDQRRAALAYRGDENHGDEQFKWRSPVPLDKESLRCLRFLAKNPANLEWPCRNITIPWLVDQGLARKVRDYRASWGHRMHDCAEIAITDAGRKALQQTPGA